ncbi:MAG: type I phosphomannose isomerase catalytic subunit [Euryarchaeota archaeon]|nr:type I phosphomannose isomerase catalytic subunit [Euryarchaeota archaeon]
MFDYVVVVVGEDSEVKNLERTPLRGDVLLNSILVPVSESAWTGAAGNGLGTLFAIENASTAIRENQGKNLVEEVTRGKSVLIVHTAGKGTRNILTRTCKNKAYINVPELTILEGVIKQFQDFAIPSRILVTWGDQFLLFGNSAEEIRTCAQNAHVMLFGLKTTLTQEVATKYGIQIVQCADEAGCELLDFEDTRNYELAKAKLQKHEGSTVMVNMGMFAMSGAATEHMLEAFNANLRDRNGKFNSDELWQTWISGESGTDPWLRARAAMIKTGVLRTEPLALIASFPLSAKTVWQDFGTNASYYETMMQILADDDVGQRLRDFLAVNVLSVNNGCKVRDSVYDNTEFAEGQVKNCVVSNSSANSALLEQACVINSRLNRIRGKNCVVYNVVDHGTLELEDCVLVDVFHPLKGKIRLKMRIGEEKGAKAKWWDSRLPGNVFSLIEVAAMMKGVSESEIRATKETFERLTAQMNSEVLIDGPIRIKPFKEDKPWGYELWCASPRNYCELETGQEFTLDDLTALFPEKILGRDMAKFPLIVKIIKADENLSVQVHPDDAYARKLGDVLGKEEAWHVLKASPTAKIYLGFKQSMNADELEDSAKSADFMARLNAFSAIVDDTYHIPAGTIHALGAGTKIYEVSTASEKTFRIYDYGRGRELHLKDAMNVLKFEALKDAKTEHVLLRRAEGCEAYLLLKGEQIELQRFKVLSKQVKVFTGACLITCVEGEVTLKSSTGVVTSLTPPETVLVPACAASFEVLGAGEVICAKWLYHNQL